ncbi:MAG: Bug family tripartite tricarboxylate transporter substrate binding protein [Gemmatimonadales bacterium]
MKFIGVFAIAVLGMLGSASALAQAYPSRPITLVVSFAAGSGTDGVARIVGQKLSERLKQPVVVDNKAGANGQIAADYVKNAKPDGYTLWMTTNTTHSANPSLVKELRYDPIKDFTPIILTGELPFALVVNNDLPVKNLKEFMAYARANPGKISYATPNSTSLVASETMRVSGKLDIVGIPYKASPQALTDTMSGQVQMYVVDFGSGLTNMKANKVRTLAVTPARKSMILPDVPSIGSEIPGFDLTSWNGIFGPAGLPKEVVDRIASEVQAVLADKEVQDKLALTGFEVHPSKSPAEFQKYVADQLASWSKMIKAAGIKAE